MKYKILRNILIALMIAIMPLSCVALLLEMSVEAAGTVADFGIENSERNTSIEGSELLTLLSGIEAIDAEADYIDQSGMYKFVYSDTIPASKIVTEMTDSGLAIKISNWEYVAKNGKTVSWIPVKVTVNGITRDVNGAGTYLFENDWTDIKEFDISAVYQAELSISEALYNSLINYAYRDAVQKSGELSKYEDKKAKYDASLIAYEEYRKKQSEYNSSLALYNVYLARVDEYNRKLTNYENYLKRLEKHLADEEAYDTYLKELEKYNTQKEAYTAYLSALGVYQEQLISYNNYLKAVETRKGKLAVMDAMFATNSEGRSMYYILNGNPVSMVIENKDDVVDKLGVDEAAVDLAGECTENLKAILAEYRKLKTDEEKYLYYVKKYDDICSNYKGLYESLYSFYDNDVVRSVLNTNGKIQRYRELLAQLYVITTSLDDSLKRDSNWRLEVQKNVYSYVSDLLEDAHIISDSGMASPKSYKEWPDEVKEPVVPKKVNNPTKPTEVSPPGNPPVEVLEPKAPDVVQAPVKPTEVKHPGATPKPIGMTAAQKAIVEAYRAGKITERSEVDGDVVIKMTETVSKTVTDINKHHVRFLNGKDIVYEYDIVDGEMLIFPTELPQREDSDEFVYSFKCWEDEFRETASAAPVNSDLDFYACFSTQRKSYNITWNVGGVKHVDLVEYGAVPEFTGSTDRPMSESKIYIFADWDNTPARVTGDAEYTAQYTETDRLYNVTWTVDGASTTEQYKYSEVPTYKGITDKESDSTYAYIFEGWDKDIAPVTGDASYVAVYTSKDRVTDSSGTSLPIKEEDASYIIETDAQQNINISTLYSEAHKKEFGIVVSSKKLRLTLSSYAISEYSERGIARLSITADKKSARITFYDDDGGMIIGGAPILLEYEYPYEAGVELSYTVNGEEKPLKIIDDKVSLLVSSGQIVRIKRKYSVNIKPSDFGDVNVEITTTQTTETETEAIEITETETETIEITESDRTDIIETENTETADNTETVESETTRHENTETAEGETTRHENTETVEGETTRHENTETVESETSRHENTETVESETSRHENTETVEGETSGHENIETVESETSRHENIETVESETSRHENTETVESETSRHENIETDESETSRHEDVETDESETSRHENTETAESGSDNTEPEYWDDEIETEAPERVKVDVGAVKPGYYVKAVHVTSVADGTPVDFDMETMTFIMPDFAVNIEVEYDRLSYTVKFVCEGEIISEKKYFYGDEVEIPEAPTKEQSGDFIYTFAGWTPEIVIVQADAEYEATFYETKLADESEMNEHNFQNREYKVLWLFAAAGAVVAGVVLTVCLCVKGIRKRRSSKRRKKDSP